MSYQVRLEQHTGCHLAVVRRRASQQELSDVVPKECGKVWGALRADNVPGMGRHIAVYLDDQINMEIGVEVESPFPRLYDIVGSTTPAGPVATTTHFGPYEQLHLAHQAIHDWCRTNGRQLAGPSWEVYGHWQEEWEENPSQIRTDVFYLLT